MKTYNVYPRNVFEVTTNADLNEARGPTVLIGFFSKETDAHVAAKGRGPMGTDGDVKSKIIDVFVPVEVKPPSCSSSKKQYIEKFDESFTFYRPEPVPVHDSWVDPRTARERALKKLTKEEIELLGLK